MQGSTSDDGTKPSKPPGCRSRRCRRRTWRSCAALTRPSTDGDLGAVSDVVDPEIEFDARRSRPDARVYSGPRTQALAFDGLARALVELVQIEPTEFVDAGDQVVAVVSLARGHGRAASTIECRSAHLCDDPRRQARSHDGATANRDEALEAAGLSE